MKTLVEDEELKRLRRKTLSRLRHIEEETTRLERGFVCRQKLKDSARR